MIVRDKWGNNHIVKDNHDNKDIIINTSHTFQELTPEDILTRKGYNFNTASTRVNESRPVTMIVNEPTFRKTFPGVKIGKKVRNW